MYSFPFLRDTDENLEKGGQIPFLEIDGFNPGLFFEKFLYHSNPKNNFLFTKPQRAAQWFNIHSNDTVCYYEIQNVGVNTIKNVLSDLCDILGLPHTTNGQMRPTSIRKMKRAGFGKS